MKNHPAQEAVVNHLSAAIDACGELFEAHGDDCGCDFCADAHGMLYTIKLFRDGLECSLIPFPRMLKRWGVTPADHSRNGNGCGLKLVSR